MALQLPAQEEIERGQEELRKQFLGDPAAASVANMASVALLIDFVRLEYPRDSGVYYTVPRVPYYVGLQMMDIHTRLNQSRKYESNHLLIVYQRQLRQLLELAWSMMVPESFWKRALKKIGFLKNPLYKASEGDAADLLGFFLVRRMKSNVKFHYPAQAKENEATTRSQI